MNDGDVVYFMDSGDINHREGVQILGQVRHPGTYEYGENLSLGDLIFMAGGFNSKALSNKVILSRKVKDQNILAEIVQIEAQSDYWNNQKLFTTFLKPGDVVSTYINPFVREQVYVSMEGEINNPGVYPIDSRSQTLWDVYQRVGGVNNYGILKEAVLIRMKRNSIADIETSKRIRKMYNEIYLNEAELTNRVMNYSTRYDTIALVNLTSVYDLDKILKSIVVEPGDRFIVPKQRNTVRIEGAVYNSNTVFFNSKTQFKDYILMGGGLMANADLSNVFVTYSNGTSKRTKVILGLFKRYPKVAPGSVLTIPFKQENRENEKLSLTERLALYSIISTSISSLAFILTAVIN
jgi:protein involved in polysaccharide export with SLBB domain